MLLCLRVMRDNRFTMNLILLPPLPPPPSPPPPRERRCCDVSDAVQFDNHNLPPSVRLPRLANRSIFRLFMVCRALIHELRLLAPSAEHVCVGVGRLLAMFSRDTVAASASLPRVVLGCGTVCVWQQWRVWWVRLRVCCGLCAFKERSARWPHRAARRAPAASLPSHFRELVFQSPLLCCSPMRGVDCCVVALERDSPVSVCLWVALILLHMPEQAVIHCRNLPANTSEEELTAAFAPLGRVVAAKMMATRNQVVMRAMYPLPV